MINNMAVDSRMICIICIGTHLGDIAVFAAITLSASYQTMFDYWPGTVIAKSITHTFDMLGHVSGSSVACIGLKQSGWYFHTTRFTIFSVLNLYTFPDHQ